MLCVFWYKEHKNLIYVSRDMNFCNKAYRISLFWFETTWYLITFDFFAYTYVITFHFFSKFSSKNSRVYLLQCIQIREIKMKYSRCTMQIERLHLKSEKKKKFLDFYKNIWGIQEMRKCCLPDTVEWHKIIVWKKPQKLFPCRGVVLEMIFESKNIVYYLSPMNFLHCSSLDLI